MPARRQSWPALLLCMLTACGRFGFAGLEVADESRPSSAPPEDRRDAERPTLPEAGSSEDAGTGTHVTADAGVQPDASGTDADAGQTVDAGTPGCSNPPAGSFWCADFDQEIPAGSYVDAYRGDATLVNSPAYRGSGSVEAKVYRSRGYAAVAVDLQGHPTSTLHARGYVFIRSGVVADDFTILHLGHWSSPLGGTDIDITGGKLETFSYADSSVIKSDVSVPRDQWFCLQLSVEVASVGGSVRVSVDGQQVIDGKDLVTLPPEGVTDFAMGLPWTGPQQPDLSVFIDEVAIGASPIDCL